MRKFNSKVVAEKTWVKIVGSSEWFLVKKVNDTKANIEVSGLLGSFQVGHVTRFTNKSIPA